MKEMKLSNGQMADLNYSLYNLENRRQQLTVFLPNKPVKYLYLPEGNPRLTLRSLSKDFNDRFMNAIFQP